MLFIHSTTLFVGFNEGERLSGLQRGDAKFVDIIHSNAGILGIKEVPT